MAAHHYSLRASPSTAICLVLAILLRTGATYALPRATPTVARREFEVELWPIEPTGLPVSPNKLQIRQLNTICGYIGGDPDLPATCSAGSHCAANAENSVIGCCPDDGPCTQGIFTGCVDGNSDAQTEINPYVYTCSGGDVCYQNQFPGGFFQYGCGSASSLANSVATAASGRETVNIASVSAALTQSAISLSEPTTIGTQTQPQTTDASSETDSTASSSSSDASTSDESTTTESETTTSEPSTTSSSSTSDTSTSASESETSAEGGSAPNNEDDDGTNVGAIVGGAVGGVAGVAALLTLGIWLWRRKSRNSRQGPGRSQSTEFITSVNAEQHDRNAYADHYRPMTDNRQQFSQLPTTWEEPEPEVPPNVPRAYGGLGTTSTGWPLAQHYESNSSGSTTRGAAVGGSGPYEADREPLTGELDDFSRGFNTALDEVDADDSTQANSHGMGAYGRPRGRGEGSALWQQNRRRSRNLMWM